LGQEIPSDEIADAVVAVAGAIEVVGTRFSDGLAGKGRWIVTADCGANIAFVCGQWHYDLGSLDLKKHAGAAARGGIPVGYGADLFGAR
jgi:2-keto-4-pentenoate hydratase